MNQIKTGIIGCGMVAQREVLPRFFFEKDKITLTAVCDIDGKRAEKVMKQYDTEECYTDYLEMLEKADIDAVLNLTPIKFHYKLNLDSLKAGKHLYTQKPMTLTTEEATKLIDISKKKNVKLVASPGQMLYPNLRKAKELIDKKVIGKLCMGCFPTGGVQHELTDRGGIDPSWYYKKEGGGPLYDYTIYSLHTLTGLMGSAKRVSAFSGIAVPERNWMNKKIKVEVDDNTVMILDFGNSTFAMINGTSAARSTFREDYSWRIHGSRGAIMGIEEKDEIIVYFEEKILNFQSGWFQPARPWLDEAEAYKGGAPWIWADILHFVHCIRNDKKPIASGEHARHVIEIIEKTYDSARTGEVQNLKTSFEVSG